VEPPDAEVYVDGFLIGMTPLMDYRLPPGQHSIVIDMKGYELWARNMVFNPGSPTRIKVTLAKEVKDPEGENQQAPLEKSP
jgi:hypothetical protein